VDLTVQGYRLSTQQRRIWLLYESAPARLCSLILLTGPLDKRSLTNTLTELVQRQVHTLMLLPALLNELEVFARRQHLTIFILLSTALKALLHTYIGKQEVELLSSSANRQQPETQRVFGWLSTLIMLPADLSAIRLLTSCSGVFAKRV
jgi:hypothetical protein